MADSVNQHLNQAAFNVTQGRVVLFRTDPDKYLVALIIKVNDDKTVDLTVFKPSGDTGLEANVKQGKEIGNWCPPGVDAVKK
jgi:hypothetical protein